MPTYEYRCQQCQYELDAMQKMSDMPLTTCPSCGTEKLVRLISRSSFQLKGEGWYVTEYKKKLDSKSSNDAEVIPKSDRNDDSAAKTNSGANAAKPAETGKPTTVEAA